MNIEEGPHIYLERIDIVGNAKTRDYVIRRELRISGDAVNAFLLDRAKKRVQALGFFKSVTLKRIIGSAPDRIILTIEMVEDDTRSVSLGIAYSQTYGIVGDTALTERNLFGTGVGRAFDWQDLGSQVHSCARLRSNYQSGRPQAYDRGQHRPGY